MIIPHQQLSAEALQGILEEFVGREGTDYGLEEVALERKLTQLRLQLDRGEIVVVLDSASETVSLLPRIEAEALQRMAQTGAEQEYFGG